ncbi:hypothetical protein M427DRAFT_64593 [Gonapodya prolifera JEL478]|uniref:non-specific serine/threonine protein kinase n=1 Tax=Gonapodya prolifera (strain JEL478) TaxID=1344416 RepID=A0A138ZXJ3_GONPJ|nr:hypothetical protein M427DRAFT_64593 [Gonapodya prolifera JEL478]|eukprot:KXS09216.1 hypothetical protein M427DRAFT_64593 [Gonapodya prolifera JEL478]
MSLASHPHSAIISQGAEACVFRIEWPIPLPTLARPPTTAIAKHRPPKPYRHPLLDAKITPRRVLSEARCLARLTRAGVDVPRVFLVDPEGGVLYMEDVPGLTVKEVLWAWAKEEEERGGGAGAERSAQPQDADSAYVSDRAKALAESVGLALANMHAAEVVHGDLTTSNMIVRGGWPGVDAVSGTGAGSGLGSKGGVAQPSVATLSTVTTPRISLIDFGLAHVSPMIDDRAVDLYVLKRAMLSTHPEAGGVFAHILDTYACAAAQGSQVVRQLAEVERRGRKRSMVG